MNKARMMAGTKAVVKAVLGAAVLSAAVAVAPQAHATALGNFSMAIPDRYDFHTWIWSMSPCVGGPKSPECIHVYNIAQPIAKAFNYQGDVYLVDGRYTLTVDDPYGLRCGNVYYGPTSATHDVYSWDAATMAGTLTSTFDAGCDGAPGTLTYPFWLSRW